LSHWPEGGVGDLGKETAVPQVRIVEDLVVRLDQPAGYTGRDQRFDPVFRLASLRDRLDQRNQLMPVLVPRVVVLETRVLLQVRKPKHVTASVPIRRRGRTDGEESVLRPQCLVRRGSLVSRPQSFRHLTGGEVAPGLPD